MPDIQSADMRGTQTCIKINSHELDAVHEAIRTRQDSQKHSKNELELMRDIAVVTLFIGTGIKVSECARLNIKDIDTQNALVNIMSEGTVKKAVQTAPRINDTLKKYIDERIKTASPEAGDALFLNSRLTRANSALIKSIKDRYDDIVSQYISSGTSIAQTRSLNKEYFNNILSLLPPFCKTYFMGIAQRTTELTRLNYARDLNIFFIFLREETEEFAGIDAADFKVEMLDDVSAEMIEQFLFYVTDYESTTNYGNSIDRFNDIPAKSRKLSAISSMYRYFMQKKQIEKNPVEMVEKPKKRDHAIIRLDPAEVANLLDAVESGEGQSAHQKKYNESLVTRDVAILTLFLGTGMRISECTGINIKDIDFAERAILITRKGQKQDVVYYGDEVEEALNNYLKIRNEIKPAPGSEDALFLSGQNRRISNRAVEYLVKKYAGIVTPLKHITPHKLRSTFGTNLYQETGDIYLVATVLGHTDVNTTRKHYASQTQENKILASKAVRLRKEKND